MRSTILIILSSAAFALAKPYNPYATSDPSGNEEGANLENFFRHHHHRRTHRPRPTTEKSITTAAEADIVTGNIEVVTPAAEFHRTPRNRITRRLSEQSSDVPVLAHGADVTDNSNSHVTQKDLHRHHHRRRTAHPLPTGKISTSADAGEATGSADGVTPAAKHAAVVLTGEPDAKAHRTLGGRFTRKPSTSEPDARAHRTGWVGRITRRPSTAEPEGRAHRTKASATGLPHLITAESAAHATNGYAWIRGHVAIAA